MIKTILPALSISSLFLTSIAQAEVPHTLEGWYVAGSLGNYLNRSIPFTKDPMLGASLGYKKDFFRLEGQYLYQHLEALDLFKGNYNALRLNGIYDFDNHTVFSPYVGLSVEGSKTRYNSGHYPIKLDDTSFNLGPIFGIRAYLTNNVALDLSYRSSFAFSSGAASLGVAYHF